MANECACTLTIDLSEDELRRVTEVVERLGLDLQTVTCAFLEQLVLDHKIPLLIGSEGWIYDRAHGWRNLCA